MLLVEDNPINQQVAEQILLPTGIEINSAPNGKEATRMVQETAYDIVLMDIQMPEMDGYEATAKIRNELGMTDLPIIAMTAHAMRGDKERCLESGMDDYIPKPIDKEQMVSIIRAQLQKRGGPQNSPAPQETALQANPEAELRNAVQCRELDIEEVLERIGGDMGILVSILRNFKEYNTQFHADTQALLRNNQLKEAGDKAHTLKGSAANISAQELAVASLELEKACKADLMEDAEQALEKTAAKLELLFAEISLLEQDYD